MLHDILCCIIVSTIIVIISISFYLTNAMPRKANGRKKSFNDRTKHTNKVKPSQPRGTKQSKLKLKNDKYNFKRKIKKAVLKQVQLKFNNSHPQKHSHKVIESLQNKNNNLMDVIEHNYVNQPIDVDINMEDNDSYTQPQKLSNLDKIKLMRLSQLTAYKNVREVVDIRKSLPESIKIPSVSQLGKIKQTKLSKLNTAQIAYETKIGKFNGEKMTFEIDGSSWKTPFESGNMIKGNKKGDGFDRLLLFQTQTPNKKAPGIIKVVKDRFSEINCVRNKFEEKEEKEEEKMEQDEEEHPSDNDIDLADLGEKLKQAGHENDNNLEYQFEHSMADGSSLENKVLKDLFGHRKNFNFWKCLTHGLEDQFKGVAESLADSRKRNKCGWVKYKSGLLVALEIIFKIFGINTYYLYNQKK
eukprot:484888_1